MTPPSHLSPAASSFLENAGKWHSRGYLPHFDKPGLVQALTFRLHDSVPIEKVNEWKDALQWREGVDPNDSSAVELRRKIDQFEDTGFGACHLRDPRIAGLVQNALLHFDGSRYRLLAWCIMPSHVHTVIETRRGHPVERIIHSWKSFTAKEAYEVLGLSGKFWMEDYHDRFIRDEKHFEAVVRYIEQNPVKVGLVVAAEEWAWCHLVVDRARTESREK